MCCATEKGPPKLYLDDLGFYGLCLPSFAWCTASFLFIKAAHEHTLCNLVVLLMTWLYGIDRVLVIKVVWQGRLKDRHIYKSNTTKFRNRPTHIRYSTCDNSVTIIPRGKDVIFNKWCMANWLFIGKKSYWFIPPTVHKHKVHMDC